MKYRLWLNGEDYGTTSERAGQMWLEHVTKQYPAEVARLEPVADDAPIFLPFAKLVRADGSPSPRTSSERKTAPEE